MANRVMEDVNRLVEDYRGEILRVTQELVRIPSENIAPRGYEKKAQDYIQNFLKRAEVEVDVFTPYEVEGLQEHQAFFPGRDYTDRPNVVALRRGKGNGHSLIFSSHVDVVSPKPLPWKTGDPYSGKLEEGKIFGRGSFDMKGGLVATLFVLKILSDNNVELRGDVIVESVVDEENGGSNGTLASRVKGYNADVAIIPEPTLLEICPACKGGRYYKVETKGVAGTGYGGEKISNPIYLLSPLIQAVEEFEKTINSNVKTDPLFQEDEKPRPVILDKIQAGDLDPGGNIGIPDQAWFTVFMNFLLEHENPDAADEEFYDFLDQSIRNDERFHGFKPIYTALSRYLYPFKSDPDHPVVKILSRGVQQFLGSPPVVRGAKFACDGFIFKKYFNTETYVMGPRGGNAHAQDEYVLSEDLVSLTKVFLTTTLEWCGT